MKMKIAAAITVAIAAVIGLAVAQDFNDFNNFNDFGDDNSAFFGPAAFGGASLAAGPAFGGAGGFSGGFAAPSFVPLPAPQASSGLGIASILPIFFLLFIILFSGSSGSSSRVIVINSTLTGQSG